MRSLLFLAFISIALGGPPPFWQKALMARYIIHTTGQNLFHIFKSLWLASTKTSPKINRLIDGSLNSNCHEVDPRPAEIEYCLEHYNKAEYGKGVDDHFEEFV